MAEIGRAAARLVALAALSGCIRQLSEHPLVRWLTGLAAMGVLLDCFAGLIRALTEAV